MAITTGDGYIASSKQIIPYAKITALTTVATTRYTFQGAIGNPAAPVTKTCELMYRI